MMKPVLQRREACLAPLGLPGAQPRRTASRSARLPRTPPSGPPRAAQRQAAADVDRPAVLEAEVLQTRDAAEPAAAAEAPGRWQRLVAALAKGTAACALAAVLVLSSVGPALAARSGGRIGGSGFSSAGAMGGGMSRSLGGGMSRSLGSSPFGGAMSRAPLLSGPSSSRPLLGSGTALGWGLSPFGGYGGYGYGYGYPQTTVVTGGGGGGLGTILVVGLLAALAYTVYQNVFARGGDYEDGEGYEAAERVSMVKLQVALIGSARTLQRRLERIADKADTDTTEGLHYVLQETVLELMRHPEYAVYGEGAVVGAGSLAKGEAAFNEASLRERGKIKEETLVNVGGQRRGGRMSRAGGSGIQELIVVTILAAVRGRVAIPTVTSREELTTALAKLGGVGRDQTLAVEVLWTPQDEDDSYSRDELLMDYPTMNTL